MDLGGEALGSFKAKRGGCTQIQVSLIPLRDALEQTTPVFSSSTNHREISSKHLLQTEGTTDELRIETARCTNSECGMEFSKASLQDNAYIQIKGLPA